MGRRTDLKMDEKRKILNLKYKNHPISAISRMTGRDRKYLKCPFNCVLFTDETRASLDGPDNWQRGWVLENSPRPVKFVRQKQGGSLMLWAGIINDRLIGPFRVPDGVKLTADSYIEFLKKNFLPFFKKLSSDEKKEFLFMQDNAPSHSAKKTKKFLVDEGVSFMDWPPNSPDLNPIENFWSFLKAELYKNGQKFRSKNDLWAQITHICETVDKKNNQKYDWIHE